MEKKPHPLKCSFFIYLFLFIYDIDYFLEVHYPVSVIVYSVSPDVEAAMLVSLTKGRAAMLVFPTNPLGMELYSCSKVRFCFR